MSVVGKGARRVVEPGEFPAGFRFLVVFDVVDSLFGTIGMQPSYLLRHGGVFRD